MRARIPSAFFALLVLAVSGCARESPRVAQTATPPAAPDWSGLLSNPRIPAEGLLTGGQPDAEQLAAAAEAGFRTVINLRMPDERGLAGEQEIVESLGMAYVSIPIPGGEGMTEANARRLTEALESAESPVMLHCGSGNRVGGLLALKAFHVDGKSAEEALEIGRQAGLTRLEGTVRERLAAAAGE